MVLMIGNDLTLDWYNRLDEISSQIEAEPRADDIVALSRLFDLLRCAPQSIRQAIGEIPDQDIIMNIMDHGANESAAIRLIGSNGSYMISRGNYDLHYASVIYFGMDEEVSAEGATLSLAIVNSVIKALCVLSVV